MNILVTGAAGFIGSHVCEFYLKQNHTVAGIDNFDNYYSVELKLSNVTELKKYNRFEFYEADIRNANSLKSVFMAKDINIVIHLAAKAGVRPSIDSIEEYYDVNVNGTLSLLQTMKLYGVKKMIFASSSSVYGNNLKLPFSESDSVDNPISPYASTKKSGELLCYVYTHLYGFDITCLRFFTVYGPRQRPDLAIHKFTRLINEGKPIPFYGDGSTARDYTYILDIINGINRAAENLKVYRIYNLGNSSTVALNELVKIIETSLGKKAIIDRLPLQPGDVKITYADISKAKSELGYDPQYKFNLGIQNFIKWYFENESTLKLKGYYNN